MVYFDLGFFDSRLSRCSKFTALWGILRKIAHSPSEPGLVGTRLRRTAAGWSERLVHRMSSAGLIPVLGVFSELGLKIRSGIRRRKLDLNAESFF